MPDSKKTGCFGCVFKAAALGFCAFCLIGIVAIAMRPKGDLTQTESATPPAFDYNAAAKADMIATAKIPGLKPETFQKLMATSGFECKTHFGEIQHEWLASKESDYGALSANAFSSDASSIATVEAIAGGPEGVEKEIRADAATLFELIATLPYEGSDPTAAAKWIKENLGKNVEADFGPVHFALHSSRPGAFDLRLKVTPPKSTEEL
jgi:hypothetical protein